MLHRHLLPLLLAVTPAAAAAAEAEAPPATPAPPPAAAPAPAGDAAAPTAGASVETGAAPQWSVSATAREEWQGRFASSAGGPSESDQTARVFLNADAHSPRDAVALHGSLGLWWRFSQDYAGEDNRPLALGSPRDNPFWLDVYNLSGEWRPGGVVGSVAVGRMDTRHGTPGAFDGLALTLKPTRATEVFAFGGRSVHFFEVDQDVFEDWMVSVGAGVRGDWWKLEADYRFLTEDVTTTPDDPTQSGKIGDDNRATKARVDDHSYGVAAWVRLGSWFNARVQARGINDRYQLIGAAVHAEYTPLDMGVDVRFDVQPSTLGELNEFDNPYFLTLGESKPHLKLRVDLYKHFATSLGDYGVHLGGNWRQVLYGEDEGAFNRNLLRAYLILSAQRIAGTGLYVSAIGEMDRARDPVSTRLETLWTAGGAIGWDQKPVKAEIGTNYYAWRYVYYQSPEERADVREFYGDVKVNVLKWLALRARYSYEVFDRTIHTVTVGVSEAL